jgi:N-acetylglucosamine-6-sulfatase
MRRLKRALAVAACLANISALSALVRGAPAALAAAPAGPSPNVVVILTDDQRWDTVTPEYMPRLTGIVSNNPSITYTDAFVPNPLCCPSRASILTGDYSHTSGVFGNLGTWGGFPSFTPRPVGASISAINDTTTIAVDMKRAGYRTGLYGKYLNGYPLGHYDYVPPGWDRWFAVGTGSYYDYHAAKNGVKSRLFGTEPDDYITRVLTTRAVDFIGALSAKPFFLYFSTTAPHNPSIPDPRDIGRFDVKGYAEPPSFGHVEAGAPTYIQNRPWSAHRAKHIKAFHAKQLNSTFGVDRAIGQIWKALPGNTIVLFMSDNGYLWGEHRWLGKVVPYNESLRIPMIVIGKDLLAPLPTGPDACPPMYSFTTSCDARLVLNVDVPPTLERMAGVNSGHAIEGLDMLTSDRKRFVLEHWDKKDLPPTYCGVRSAGWMYVKYNDAEEPVSVGLYDERADPYEMNNVAVTDPDDPTVAAQLTQMESDASTLCTEGTIYPGDWPYPGS